MHNAAPPAARPCRTIAARASAMAAPSGWRAEGLSVALLLTAYLLSLLLVPPIGEFPLVDAWSYALSVRHLVEEGRLQVSEWTATTLVFQVAWGAAFAKLFGFSFSVLRFSTLTLNFAGGVALYALCREVGIGRPRALVGTLLFWFNPLTFSLSYTFMSDVPAVSLMLLATLFSARGVRRSSDLDLVVGSCFAGLAFLVRHPGILVPLAVLVYGALVPWPPRLLARRVFSIAALPALAVMGYLAWAQRHGLPHEQGRIFEAMLQHGPILWQPALILTGYILFYLGLSCLPLALGFGGSTVRAVAALQRGHRTALLLWVVAVAGLACFFAWWGSTRPGYVRWMPYLRRGTMLQVAGIGPNNVLGERPGFFTLQARIALTALAAGGLIVLGIALYRRIASARRQPMLPTPPLGMIALIGLFQFAGIFPTSAHTLVSKWISFDRYFLPLIPLAIVLGLWAAQELRPSPTFLLLGLLGMALFSLAGTHDWFSHNRLRWQLGHELVARGVPLEQIDAGMEWDGWFLYEYSQQHKLRPRAADGPFWTQRIAPATDSTYVVSFSPLPGYEVRQRREYPSWLHREPVYLYLLQRRTP